LVLPTSVVCVRASIRIPPDRRDPGGYEFQERVLAGLGRIDLQALVGDLAQVGLDAVLGQADEALVDIGVDGLLGPRRPRQIFEEVGDRSGAASALNSLGSVISDTHGRVRAENVYNQALAISEQIGDRRTMSAALNNPGILYKDLRRFQDARRAPDPQFSAVVSDQYARGFS